jgi:hypothetical protein
MTSSTMMVVEYPLIRLKEIGVPGDTVKRQK